MENQANNKADRMRAASERAARITAARLRLHRCGRQDCLVCDGVRFGTDSKTRAALDEYFNSKGWAAIDPRN